MRRLIQCAAVAALLLGVAPFAAEAQQVMALPNGFYAGVEAGAIVPQSISVHGSGSSCGETVTANGDLNFKAGPAAGVVFGAHVLPTLAIEGNFEYAGFDLHSLSGTIVATGPVAGALSGSIGLQGRFDTYNGLVNAIWTPLAPAALYGISPYIGAGVGFSHINASLTAVTVAGSTFTGSVSGDETDFAANGIIGADFPITSSLPQLTAGVRYRLLFVNTASSGSSGSIFGSNGNFFGHVFTANATWHF